MSAAVRRVIQVIQCVAANPGGVAASELAGTLRISRQAATRLLASLAGAGIMVKDPMSRRYALTLTLYEWAGQDVRRRFPTNIVRREIARLATNIEHRVDYVVLDGDSIVLLERTDWQDGIVSTVPLLARSRWSQTASGKAIAAFSPSEVLNTLLARLAKDKAEESRAVTLRTEISAIREIGYAEAELSPGRLGLAAPVIDASGFALGAIGIPLIETEESSSSIARYVAPLKEAAARCAEELGYALPVAVA